jgi:DNA-binding beta-propeller fold protein YncE
MSEPISASFRNTDPRGIALTRDGCWAFVGLVRRTGVAVLRRTSDKFEEVYFVPVASAPNSPQLPFGLALTRDQKVLVASHHQRVTFFDVEKLTSSRGDSVLGYVEGPRFGGSFGVAITPDDQHVFVAQYATASVALIDLKKARASGFDQSVLVGVIPTADLPQVPVLSPDARHLYTATRIAPDVVTPSLTCLGGKVAEGSIQIVDVERARSDPRSPPIGFAYPAGCAPTWMAVSPDGDRVSAVAAGDFMSETTPPADNALVVFDVRPVREGKSPVLIGKVPLSRGPTSVVDTGSQIIVGFVARGSEVVVIDPSKVTSGEAAIIGTIPIEATVLKLSEDRRRLFGIGLFGAGLIEVDLERVSLNPPKTSVPTGRPAEPPRECNKALPKPISVIGLSTAARGVRPTRDGCWVFAGLVRRQNGQGKPGVGVLRRTGDKYEEVHFVPLPSSPEQRFVLTLTHDQKVLIASHYEQVTFFDVEKLTAGRDALLGHIRRPGISYAGVAITPGDQYAFVAQSQGQVASVIVIDLKKGRASGFDESALVAAIPITSRPSNLFLSPDGRYLFAASKQPPGVISPALTCLDGKESEGAIYIIDAQKATVDPKNATIASASPAGCEPGYTSLSPNGERLSVIAANFQNPATPADRNAVVVFDARPLRDGKAPTLIGKVPLASAPTTIVDTGNRIVAGHGGQDLIVIDPAKVESGRAAIMGSMPISALGGTLLDDGRTLVAFQPNGGLVIIDLERVQLEPPKK